MCYNSKRKHDTYINIHTKNVNAAKNDLATETEVKGCLVKGQKYTFKTKFVSKLPEPIL